jgi:membrane-associated protease RseP (regulator of RpoE activity)
MKKNTRNALIALAVVAVIALGVLGGAVAGGVTGYFAGKKAAQGSVTRRLEILREPMQPFVRPLPRVIPPAEPHFEWDPDLPGYTGGAQVTEVIEGTPADEVDLREGDIVTHVDGERVTPLRSLSEMLQKLAPGDHVELTIRRDERELTVGLLLAEHPEEQGKPYLGIYYRTVFFSHKVELPWDED